MGSRHGNPVVVREGVHGSVATFVVHSIARSLYNGASWQLEPLSDS